VVFAGDIQPIAPTENEPVGKRPYEMVNAGRNTDTRPAFIDFENLANWKVETGASEAVFRQSRRQQLWGDYVGHLSYKHLLDTDKQPVFVRFGPGEPMPIFLSFDSATLWVYGNSWDYIDPPEIPLAHIVLLFRNARDELIEIYLDRVRWKEWFLLHHKFHLDELAGLGTNPRFVGIEIRGGTNTEFADLFFDNLTFYKEELRPLEFASRPKRPITLPEGQTVGTNTGPDVLPFPNREETILPGSLDETISRTAPEKTAIGLWQLKNFYCTGNFSSIGVSCGGDHRIDGGGLDFGVPESEVVSEMLSAEIVPDNHELVLRTLWRYTFQGKECLAKWTFRCWNNSLVVDVEAKGGLVRGVNLGKFVSPASLEQPIALPVPYLSGTWTSRPFVTMLPGNTDGGNAGESRLPIFFLATVDHTRSNGSELFFGEGGSGVKYLPKTDGTYNDCFERIFVTVSPTFVDVLPNIPNPVSPWRHVTAARVWFPYGASPDREQDYQYWQNMHRFGFRQIIINDHETGWRDGGESFTFRTYAAPGKGGDEGQLEYTKRLHALGYYYGPYNQYTDYSPVNEFWNEDWVSRLSNGQWRSAWARCYSAKAEQAVEAGQKIATIVQNKFHFNTAYCDVHTCVRPWDRVDYDVRVPGAGTFAANFYAYGEIMLHQKQIWGGPVYSEGDAHWYFCGLTDGNYAQDMLYFKHNPDWPWLVDFDLVKMHPLGNSFGMGYPSMFYSREEMSKPDAIDRFLAATLAFGHTGYLTAHGIPNAVKGYFLVQAIAERVGTQNVSKIRYADEKGNLLPTERALDTGAYQLNRIEVTYEDGFTISVNGNRTCDWDELPPHGFRIHDPAGKITAACQYVRGTRFDYVDSPDYLYADGRGHLRRFGKMLCDGQLIVRKNKTEPWEVIPVREGQNPCKTLAFAVSEGSTVTSVMALNKNRNELGQADVRQARGMVHIFPKEGEFSYFIEQEQAARTADAGEPLYYVVPGMRNAEFNIPENAETSTMHWISHNDQWHDFIVLPLCDLDAEYDQDTAQLTATVRSNYPEEIEYSIVLDGVPAAPKIVSLNPDRKKSLVFDLDKPTQPGTCNIEVIATAHNTQNELALSKPFVLVSEMAIRESSFPEKTFESGYTYRNGDRVSIDSRSGAGATRQDCTSGGVVKVGWDVHPPYIGGVGYVFLLSEPIALPTGRDMQLTASIGIRDGNVGCDGITYKIIVLDAGEETEAASVHHVENKWEQITADLSRWRGKSIRLLFITDVGPNDNPSGDWGCWADFRLSGVRQELTTVIR